MLSLCESKAERNLLRERLRQASAEASARAAQLDDQEVEFLIEQAREQVYQEGKTQKSMSGENNVAPPPGTNPPHL